MGRAVTYVGYIPVMGLDKALNVAYILPYLYCLPFESQHGE
jgi:hypothetical protein